MFQVAVKSKRQERCEGLDRQRMPPTQIARALGELGIVWIPAHSPGLTGGLAPSASEPAPSQRSSDLPQGARLPRNIEPTLTPTLRPAPQNRTFLLCWE